MIRGWPEGVDANQPLGTPFRSGEPVLYRAVLDAAGRGGQYGREEALMSDPDLRRDVAALRDELVAAAHSLDPFPAFPGAAFAYGIEIVPSEGEDPELGCVILGNDGALYELQIGIDDTKTSPAVVDASIERHEELVPLDVPDEVYVRYARAALEEVARRRAE